MDRVTYYAMQARQFKQDEARKHNQGVMRCLEESQPLVVDEIGFDFDDVWGDAR